MMYDAIEEGLSKVVRKSTLVYPITTIQNLSGDRRPQCYEKITWNPIDILDLRRFKEAIISSGVHSSYMKQILNLWST